MDGLILPSCDDELRSPRFPLPPEGAGPPLMHLRGPAPPFGEVLANRLLPLPLRRSAYF